MDSTGCQAHDKMRRSFQIIRHIYQNKIQTMLMSFEAEKAFDFDGCKFPFNVMENFGF